MSYLVNYLANKISAEMLVINALTQTYYRKSHPMMGDCKLYMKIHAPNRSIDQVLELEMFIPGDGETLYIEIKFKTKYKKYRVALQSHKLELDFVPTENCNEPSSDLESLLLAVLSTSLEMYQKTRDYILKNQKFQTFPGVSAMPQMLQFPQPPVGHYPMVPPMPVGYPGSFQQFPQPPVEGPAFNERYGDGPVL